jgi:site-specific recombinase XerD
MSLTERAIAALKPPVNGQRFHADGSIPGFGVRISQGGARSFVLTVGANRRKITIGRYPIVSLAQAREKAKTILAQRQLGLDKPLSPFFDAVADEYRAAREDSLRATTVRKDPYRFRWFRSLGRTRLADITPPDVQHIIAALPAHSSKTEAYLIFTGLIRFAQKRGYIENWPMNRLECDLERRNRERVLDTHELAIALTTARTWRSGGHPLGDIIELLILTGQRRGQVGSLDRSYVDVDEGTITWPAQLMKSNRRHVIPMGSAVRALLEPRRVNGLFFPNKYGEPFSFSTTSVAAFKRDCGFADWVLHDLRRTLATRWQEMGIEIATTEKMLSHSAITGGLVGIYQRSSYLTEMRAACAKWETYLGTLLSITEETGALDIRDLHRNRA